jgi:hypothetical protein
MEPMGPEGDQRKDMTPPPPAPMPEQFNNQNNGDQDTNENA